MADTSPSAQVASLKYQSSRFIPGVCPTTEESEDAIVKTVLMYQPSTVPKGFETEDAVFSRQMVRNAIEDLKGNSVPGYPYCFTYGKKKLWKENRREELVDMVINRISKLLAVGEEIESMSAIEMVDRGLVDPVAIFVKNEAHTMEKIAQGRWRLISNCTLIDEIIARMLSTNQKKVDDRNCYNQDGSAGGWDWSTDGSAARCYESVEPWISEAASNDARAWDWSLRRELFDIDDEIRRRLNGASKSSSWFRLKRNSTICKTRKVFVTTDGRLFCLVNDGVQLSGHYDTTTTNCRIRNFVAVFSGSKHSKSAGDDNISSYVEDAVERAKKWGITLTDYKKVDMSEGFEFCSQHFTKNKAVPVSCTKPLFNVLMKKPNIKDYETFCKEFRNAQDIELAKRTLYACGYMAEIASGGGAKQNGEEDLEGEEDGESSDESCSSRASIETKTQESKEEECDW